MQLREKAHLMTGSEIERTLIHLAHEVAERTESLEDMVFIGVRRRGVYLAQRLARKIQQLRSTEVPVGAIDIRPYRDDIQQLNAEARAASDHVPFSLAGKDVLLVDDVLQTGRTTRAALDALLEHGRPRRVRLCVLIDRGQRELPIEASFVGKRVEAGADEVIEVRLQEEDDSEKVLLLERAEAPAGS